MSYRATNCILALCISGCTSEPPSIAPTADGDAVARFSAFMASGQFEEAAQLVRTPTRFYKDGDGYWVMASPGVDPKTELTIRAVPNVWIARFVNGKLKATTTSYCAAEEAERSCYYLRTNIMCDPLQMFVLLVPDSDRVMLVVEPIGDRADFTLE